MNTSVCMGGEVQNWWVSLSLKSRVGKQEGLMSEIESKELLPSGPKDLLSLCFTCFCLSAFHLNMWKTVSVHAGFYFQLQDHLHLKFGFRLLKGRNYLQCANVNVERSCPGSWWYIISRVSVAVLYLNSVSLPSHCKHNLHPFCLLRGKEIEATKTFPVEWLIFTLQERSRIATSTNH